MRRMIRTARSGSAPAFEWVRVREFEELGEERYARGPWTVVPGHSLWHLNRDDGYVGPFRDADAAMDAADAMEAIE